MWDATERRRGTRSFKMNEHFRQIELGFTARDRCEGRVCFYSYHMSKFSSHFHLIGE